MIYLAAGLRLLPGFVKLNGYLQQVESYKPSLNLIHKELLDFDQEFIINKNDKNIDTYSIAFGSCLSLLEINDFL